MTRPVPLLIDTDPGVDDALALLLAFNDESHETVGLSITAGNVGLDYTLANALKLVEYCNVNAPVFPGAAAPLVADRKSTRLNSSHVAISYAVFCLQTNSKLQE